jgi:hypothetical protein
MNRRFYSTDNFLLAKRRDFFMPLNLRLFSNAMALDVSPVLFYRQLSTYKEAGLINSCISRVDSSIHFFVLKNVIENAKWATSRILF